MSTCLTPGKGSLLGRLCALVGLVALLGAQSALAEQASREQQFMARQDAGRIEVLSGALQRIRQAGAVKLGYRQDLAPFSFVPEGWRRPVGYSIDICKNLVDVIASRLDKPLAIEWVPVNAENRFEAVAKGRIDLECGASSDTAERRRIVSFSPPIFVTGTRLLVPRKAGLQSLDELKGKRIGVVASTTADQALAAWLDKRGTHVELVGFEGYQSGFQALETGGVAALLGDEVLLYTLLTQKDKRGSYRMAGPWVSYDVYGIAFAHDDQAMQALVDNALARLAFNRELDNLYIRWFQRRLPDAPSLDLPMSPTLRAVVDMLARKASAD